MRSCSSDSSICEEPYSMMTERVRGVASCRKSETKAPLRGTMRTKPLRSSSSMPRFTLLRLRPKRSASSRSASRRAPGFSFPESICASISLTKPSRLEFSAVPAMSRTPYPSVSDTRIN